MKQCLFTINNLFYSSQFILPFILSRLSKPLSFHYTLSYQCIFTILINYFILHFAPPKKPIYPSPFTSSQGY